MTNTEEQKKVIDNFKATFKQGLSKDGEQVFLELSFNDDLRKVLKSVCIKEDYNFNYNLGYDSNDNMTNRDLKRYKVKGVIFGAIYTDNKDFLFIKKLLDSGKTKIYFNALDILERTKSNIKNSLQRALSVVMSCEVEQTISFKTE